MGACVVLTDEIMQPGCLAFCRQMAGFDNWPAPGLVKQKYAPVAERLRLGRQAYREWLETPEGAGCSYMLPETDDEDDDPEDNVGDAAEGQGPAAKKAKTSKPRSGTSKAGIRRPKMKCSVCGQGTCADLCLSCCYSWNLQCGDHAFLTARLLDCLCASLP